MKRTLGRKFLLVSLIFLLSGLGLLFLAGSFLLQRYLLSDRVSRMTSICNSVHMILSDRPENSSDEAYRTYLEYTLNLLAETGGYQIWLINPEGEILLSTDQNTGVQVPFNPARYRGYFRGTYNEYLRQDTISVYSPLIGEGSYQPSGYLLVHCPYSAVLNVRNRLLTRFFAVWCMCAALWLAGTFITYMIVHRPLRKMLLSVQQFAHETADLTLPVPAADEITALSGILDRLFVRLKEVNEGEQQFIANISHDLRSPLTSIKGYLDAIQDGTIPHEMQDKYITIVLHETERLTELTRNLLTLTSLEARQSPLERTRFDINGVIRQILLTFEQRCQQKGIRFNLVFSEKSQTVYADLNKIQQVLYNLIDNAIKFSPPDSVIDISSIPHYGKTFVSVKDYGAGIPKESLEKIWKRFYKTDPSRGRDKRGTGLGLAIVLEIINLHGESIHVNSEEGKGSEFVFSLPSA